MQEELSVEEVEEVRPIHIKRYIQYRQQLGQEKEITINNNIATLKVFFNYLVEEKFVEELSNSIRRIKSLKEEKRVIVTFNDDEVKRIITDVEEETYSNVRDKLILIMLFDTGVRVSELIGIKDKDISSKTILIHGKGLKQRLVYISKTMRKYMRRYEVLKKEQFRCKESYEMEEYYLLNQTAIYLHRSIIKNLKVQCKNAGVRKQVH